MGILQSHYSSFAQKQKSFYYIFLKRIIIPFGLANIDLFQHIIEFKLRVMLYFSNISRNHFLFSGIRVSNYASSILDKKIEHLVPFLKSTGEGLRVSFIKNELCEFLHYFYISQNHRYIFQANILKQTGLTSYTLSIMLNRLES